MRAFLGGALLGAAATSFFSSVMYSIEGSDLAFSRFALGLIMLGFLYVGSRKESEE